MSATQLFRESQDTEFEYKIKKVSDRISESMNIIANEPSLAFFRVQEHVRKSLPQLVEQKHEVEDIQQNVQGACFDTEYASNTVRGMQKSTVHFQNIQDLLKNAMFMKQQIDYKEDKNFDLDQSRFVLELGRNRREQEKMRPTMYRAETSDESMNTNIIPPDKSASSTQSSTTKTLSNEKLVDLDEGEAEQGNTTQPTIPDNSYGSIN